MWETVFGEKNNIRKKTIDTCAKRKKKKETEERNKKKGEKRREIKNYLKLRQRRKEKVGEGDQRKEKRREIKWGEKFRNNLFFLFPKRKRQKRTVIFFSLLSPKESFAGKKEKKRKNERRRLRRWKLLNDFPKKLVKSERSKNTEKILFLSYYTRPHLIFKCLLYYNSTHTLSPQSLSLLKLNVQYNSRQFVCFSVFGRAFFVCEQISYDNTYEREK